ncbi:MAG TPA: HAMP domain-containing sensor histidine kinase [Candidatus Angelobacter sp.]|nr:HAMP domain-containing sensor histidine kinase [Candidatus Angelobacter sp.]
MDKTYFQSESARRPVCDEALTSSGQATPCEGSRERDIVQVHPPRKRMSPDGDGVTSENREFFPLVSAAHEFKTPLVVMLGYADLLRSGHLGPVNDRQTDVLGEIQESAERLQKLIQNLLLLYELRAASPASMEQAQLNPVNVNEHVHEIFNFWSPAARQKSIAYEILPAGNARVRVEALKLQHIVSNLIENALKFTPARGKVTVSVSPCFWDRRKAQTEFLFNFERKSNRKVENAVRIDVSDTGPGIPPDRQEDIFRDFVQLPGASSRGTGLGLAIARRLTEAHGGAIWVESVKGKGSRFSLLLASSG